MGRKNMHYLLLFILFSINLMSMDKPNVVIILTDDLGWGDVSYHGSHIPTPNIDQLAKDGMELNRFYSNPVCSPTRASLLTGLHIFNHGVVRPFMNPAAEQTGMPPELKIMPQYFKEAGYQTALSGKWHLGSAKEEFWPSNRGFETSYGHMTGGIGYFDHTAAGRLDWHRNESTLREEGYSTVLIANEAINLIKNKDQSRPLFLYVAFNAPHTPIEAPLQSIEKFSYLEDERDRVYAANVNALDNEIGKIIKAIEDEDLLEETIILFFSDNGPVFDINPIVKVIAPNLINAKGSTAGLSGSKTSALEGGIRVPFIVMGPGIDKKRYSDTPISFSDLLPTIIDIAGNKKLKNNELDGGSIKGLINDKNNSVTRKTKGLIFHVPYENKIALERAHSAIIIDSFKLIKYHDNGEVNLYDIKNDLSESLDLSKISIKGKLINTKITRRLEKLLDDYLTNVQAPKWKPGITWKENPLRIINSYH